MLAGDQYLRNFTIPEKVPPKSLWTFDKEQTSQLALGQKAIGFNCFNYNAPAEESLSRHFLPDKEFLDANCPDGVRMEMLFPSCWNGEDLDSEDHRSHVAYPDLLEDGNCPEGFDKRIVTLFYETIWNTYAFHDKEGIFVLSHGDPTGYGYHADFINGWKQDILEKAVKECTNPSGRIEDCSVFKDYIQSEKKQQECKFNIPANDENCEQIASGLPGNVAVQSGPAPAKKHGSPSSTSAAISVPTVSASLPSVSLDPTSLLGPLKSGGNFMAQDNPAAAAATQPSSSSSSPPPESTSSPAEEPPVPLTTSYSTDGNTVHQVVVMQEKTTTTLGTSEPTQVAKRHEDAGDSPQVQHIKRHARGYHGHAH